MQKDGSFAFTLDRPEHIGETANGKTNGTANGTLNRTANGEHMSGSKCLRHGFERKGGTSCVALNASRIGILLAAPFVISFAVPLCVRAFRVSESINSCIFACKILQATLLVIRLERSIVFQ